MCHFVMVLSHSPIASHTGNLPRPPTSKMSIVKTGNANIQGALCLPSITISESSVIQTVVDKLNEKSSDVTGFVIFTRDAKQQSLVADLLQKQNGWDAKHVHTLDRNGFINLKSDNVKTDLPDCKVVVATMGHRHGWDASRFNAMIVYKPIFDAKAPTWAVGVSSAGIIKVTMADALAIKMEEYLSSMIGRIHRLGQKSANIYVYITQ